MDTSQQLECQFLISLSFWGNNIPLDKLEEMTGIPRDKKLYAQVTSGSKMSWHSITFQSEEKNGISKVLQSISEKLVKNKAELKSLIKNESMIGKISISMALTPSNGFEEISVDQLSVFSELNISLRFGAI